MPQKRPVTRPVPTKAPVLDTERVSDISEKVYRHLLDHDCGKGAAARMEAEDGDGGKKLRSRARAYDRLTRAYLTILS